MNYKKYLGAVCALVLICLCIMGFTKEEAPYVPEVEPQRTGWVVYWDEEQGYKKAQELLAARKLDQLSIFGAYYDVKGELMLAPEFDFAKYKALQKQHNSLKLFLTVVNDTMLEEPILKDRKLVQGFFATEKSLQEQAEKLVSLAKQQKMDGLELDFENLGADADMVEGYANFVAYLDKQCRKKGLELRIVLEPKSLAYAEKLPKDLNYVLMFYNLYGSFSGPGPKADAKFVRRTWEKARVLGNKVDAAFANGGFVWTEANPGKYKVEGVTSAQAEALAKKHWCFAYRDKASKAKYFDYSSDGKTVTVWYADAKTLSYWEEQVLRQGCQRVSLWRL